MERKISSATVPRCGGVGTITALAAALVAALASISFAQTPDDAVSREVSVFNDLINPVEIADTISREFTVFNDLTNPVEIIDAVSREFTVFNDLVNPVIIADAISREFSVHNDIHCTGDFDGDFAVTTSDIPLFVWVLLQADPHPAWLDAADLNCDGLANGEDIQVFVDVLLEE